MFSRNIPMPRPERGAALTGDVGRTRRCCGCSSNGPLEHEILAEKLRSILQRGRSRGHYNAWRLPGEKDGFVCLKQVVMVFNRKQAAKGLAFDVIGRFYPAARVDAAERYWNEDLKHQAGGLSPFREVVEEPAGLHEKVPFRT
jgi:hypothetical protein